MSALLPIVLIATSTASSDHHLQARLAFLDESLEGPKVHARVWWWGWLSVYSAAAVVQGTRIALVDAEDEDAGAQRADLAMSMIKAIGGVVATLSLPLNAMDGAEVMRRIEGDGPEVDRLRVAAGEAALAENARESRRSLWWLRHTILLAVNLAHGMIMWLGYDDLRRGAISAGLGIAVGELAIWTQPWQPRQRHPEYQALGAPEVR